MEWAGPRSRSLLPCGPPALPARVSHASNRVRAGRRGARRDEAGRGGAGRGGAAGGVTRDGLERRGRVPCEACRQTLPPSPPSGRSDSAWI